MKLRRAWPAICIWVVFLLFDIVMVASSSYFSGLFPAQDLLTYSMIFTVISILVMSVLTFVTGNICDFFKVKDLPERLSVQILYPALITLMIAGGFYYRLDLFFSTTDEITGKLSLFENAVVGGQNLTAEYDLLSILYSGILKGILVFTGNIISVPFIFQIACFTIFMICGFFTVRKLLGMAAAFVFTAYVAFMPVFTPAFTGPELSTDYLFMAMFGLEMLFVALFLRGAYKGMYNSKLYVFLYIFVGVAVGFMAYVDAGTIIMILPFLLSALMLYGKSPKKEAGRLLFIVLGAVLAFFGMIIQEKGIFMVGERLSNWASYYFHNLNTFSMFWTYTDHKMIYLATVIAMSGVICGFWKNRNIEKISPWLLSMIFIFATVPFMGATRMNTQVFVTVYYAFILGCVASLITLPYDEAGDEVVVPVKKEAEEEEKEKDSAPDYDELKEKGIGTSEIVTPKNGVAAPAEAKAPEKAEAMAPAESEKETAAPAKEEVAPEETASSVKTEDTAEAEASKASETPAAPVEPAAPAEPAALASAPAAPAKESLSAAEKIMIAESVNMALNSLDKAEEDDGDHYEENPVTVPDTLPEYQEETEVEITPDEEMIKAEAAEIAETVETEAKPLAAEPEESEVRAETVKSDEPEKTKEPKRADDKSSEKLFIPEGMVLPQDDADADLTPRTNVPEFKPSVGPDGKSEKIRLKRKEDEVKEEVKPKDDFDLPMKPGDDFDI